MVWYKCRVNDIQMFTKAWNLWMLAYTQGNEVYGGASRSAGMFLHRSSDDGIVKGKHAR